MCDEVRVKRKFEEMRNDERKTDSPRKLKRLRRQFFARRAVVYAALHGQPPVSTVFSVQDGLWYGFVDNFEWQNGARKIRRDHRGNRVRQNEEEEEQRLPRYATVIFDCISAPWFVQQPIFLTDFPWNELPPEALSLSARVVLTEAQVAWLNNRRSPVSGQQLLALEEGTWWALRFAPRASREGVKVKLQFPRQANPASVVLTDRARPSRLVELSVPRDLAVLRMLSHGWAFGKQPMDKPPYPGR